mmetsp:Transcript_8872/g.10890  ORF Transcript_8872/g.10890 Transcript_8872/m.10890 type:complete len:98 (-) Transcript_8872:445-738(-)
MFEDFEKAMTFWGYSWEPIEATTRDGYKLTLFHITGGPPEGFVRPELSESSSSSSSSEAEKEKAQEEASIDEEGEYKDLNPGAEMADPSESERKRRE